MNDLRRDTERLLRRIFERSITGKQLFEEAIALYSLPAGKPYSKFIWKADHYLTDIDLCNENPEYEETMRSDIKRYADEHLESKQA